MSLEVLTISDWDIVPNQQVQQQAINALEAGKVVYLPELCFSIQPEEQQFLDPTVCGKRKNVCYDLSKHQLSGMHSLFANSAGLRSLMQRYAIHSAKLLSNLLPSYIPHVAQARTSLRPVEIAGRVPKSYRKDDTRLHVDAFPASPMQGRRILRVFSNVNPLGAARVWRVGDSFANVVDRFAPSVRKPVPGFAGFLNACGITKSYRTLYDHFMLHIHDNMKADLDYQRFVPQQEVSFKAGSTWLVYTDQVSHAAMAGQHVFEQTFNLPVQGMQNQATSPLRMLEDYLHIKLL